MGLTEIAVGMMLLVIILLMGNLVVRAIRYLIHMRQVRLSLEKTRQQVSSILALANQYLALVNQSALPGEDTVPSRDAGGDNN